MYSLGGIPFSAAHVRNASMEGVCAFKAMAVKALKIKRNKFLIYKLYIIDSHSFLDFRQDLHTALLAISSTCSLVLALGCIELVSYRHTETTARFRLINHNAVTAVQQYVRR